MTLLFLLLYFFLKFRGKTIFIQSVKTDILNFVPFFVFTGMAELLILQISYSETVVKWVTILTASAKQ